MKKLTLIALCAAACAFGAPPTCAVVTGPVYQLGLPTLTPLLDGSYLDVALGYTPGGGPAQSVARITTASGDFSICLAPANYTVSYSVRRPSPMTGSISYTRYWLVPATSGPFTVTDVERTTPATPTLSGGIWGGITGTLANQADLAASISAAQAAAIASSAASLAAFTGTANIATLGTITAGIWRGSVLGLAYLPTIPYSQTSGIQAAITSSANQVIVNGGSGPAGASGLTWDSVAPSFGVAGYVNVASPRATGTYSLIGSLSPDLTTSISGFPNTNGRNAVFSSVTSSLTSTGGIAEGAYSVGSFTAAVGGTSTATITGIQANAETDSTSTTGLVGHDYSLGAGSSTANVNGGIFNVQLRGSGHNTDVAGVVSKINLSEQVILGGTAAFASDYVAIGLASLAGSSVANFAGMYVQDRAGRVLGTLGNHYGIYMDTLTAGSNIYAIYTGNNPSYFGGSMQQAGSSADPGCTVSGDVGKHWIDTTSAVTTHFKICSMVASTPAWVQVY